ncbi:fimbrial biogenesis chaperone [Neisseria chenwenguii]|uniref:Phytochrome sensor protein n=1 Tax=Neisseria chenwenguii TaxID=1853278 RepID=A0A220S0A8_9NEIS|nr:molecular chaperone [Neisseria chenwenguii]ASK26655.1 phytochrome sensor protein [Neisseria chenwenguii]ROV56317.1 molecular chaperone [Neisseria chenwenguii]
MRHFILLSSALLAAAPAFSAGLQISPISLSIPAKQRAGMFHLSNTGSRPLTAQVRVFRWEQNDKGEEVLTPSKDVLASPPMVKIAAGGKQQFRVIRTKPSSGVEEAYRLIVDELPQPSTKPLKGLQFVMRYSVPVFLNGEENPEPTLQWRVEQTGGKTFLRVTNSGKSRAQLSNIALLPQGAKKEEALANGLAGYVLPGKTWQRALSYSPAQLRAGKISATVNGRLVKPEVGFATR